MAKIKYNDITFDSELEVRYYNYLIENKINFIYHPKKSFYINSKNTYKPDFIVIYDDRIEIVETKGYSQFSFLRDNMIHNYMLEISIDQKLQFLYDNGFLESEVNGKDIIYRKIKFLQSHGWVDFDFKNPNTIANQRKNKIIELTAENKELKEFKKKCERYFSYLKQINSGKKLTKSQLEWKNQFEKEYLV